MLNNCVGVTNYSTSYPYSAPNLHYCELSLRGNIDILNVFVLFHYGNMYGIFFLIYVVNNIVFYLLERKGCIYPIIFPDDPEMS